MLKRASGVSSGGSGVSVVPSPGRKWGNDVCNATLADPMMGNDVCNASLAGPMKPEIIKHSTCCFYIFVLRALHSCEVDDAALLLQVSVGSVVQCLDNILLRGTNP